MPLNKDVDTWGMIRAATKATLIVATIVAITAWALT